MLNMFHHSELEHARNVVEMKSCLQTGFFGEVAMEKQNNV